MCVVLSWRFDCILRYNEDTDLSYNVALSTVADSLICIKRLKSINYYEGSFYFNRGECNAPTGHSAS
jgi:hypothetical protein